MAAMTLAPPQSQQVSRIENTTLTQLSPEEESKATKKRPKKELPSFLDSNAALTKGLPPLLNESTIAEIRENPGDDQSFIQDANLILNNGVDKQKTAAKQPSAAASLDVEELDECMIEQSKSRSLSEDKIAS